LGNVVEIGYNRKSDIGENGETDVVTEVKRDEMVGE
jgi:hypothetical protein